MSVISKSFYRVILGSNHSFASECFDKNFVGVDYNMDINLEGQLLKNREEFNKKFIPIYLKKRSEKTKIAARLACGAIHTMSKEINVGDCVLSPDGKGSYKVGEVSGDYFYREELEGPEEQFLRHCRPITWSNKSIAKDAMSYKFKQTATRQQTVINLDQHAK